MDTMEALSDDELVRRYLNGQEEFYFELVRRYETKVFNTALYLTDRVEEAEAILGDVFLLFSNKLASDNSKTPLFTWLLQITLDKSVHALIHANSTRGNLPESITLQTPFEEHSDAYARRNSSLRFAFQTAVSELSQDARLAFVLRDIQGKNLSEIAQLLDTNVFIVRALVREARSTIGSHLNRILEKAA